MKKILVLIVAVCLIIGCGQVGKKDEPAAVKPGTRDHLADAMQYLKEANANAAIQSFDAAIKEDPMNSETYLLLGQVYMHMKDYNRAVDTFAAAVRVSPRSGDGYYYLAMSHGLLGEMEFAIGNAQKSVEMYRQAQDEEKFVRALALLQGLMGTEEEPVENQ